MDHGIEHFMRSIARDTYPEPRSDIHDALTKEWLPKVCAFIPPATRVLDVGCGSGPALEWFRENNYSADGIATNGSDIQSCIESGFSVQGMDQNALHFCEQEFWLVWARHVIEHSIAPYWTLHEFKRVLKPGGILYVEVPAPGTSCHHETNQNHYSVLPHSGWLSLILRAGFEMIESNEIRIQTMAGPDVYFNFICKKKLTN